LGQERKTDAGLILCQRLLSGDGIVVFFVLIDPRPSYLLTNANSLDRMFIRCQPLGIEIYEIFSEFNTLKS
jgi:hypothetical protein